MRQLLNQFLSFLIISLFPLSLTGQTLTICSGVDDEILSSAISPNGEYLAVGKTNTVEVYQIATGNLLETFDGFNEKVWFLKFSPNGDVLLAGTNYPKFDTDYGNDIQVIWTKHWAVVNHLQGTGFTFVKDGFLLAYSTHKKDGRWDLVLYDIYKSKVNSHINLEKNLNQKGDASYLWATSIGEPTFMYDFYFTIGRHNSGPPIDVIGLWDAANDEIKFLGATLPDPFRNNIIHIYKGIKLIIQGKYKVYVLDITTKEIELEVDGTNAFVSHDGGVLCVMDWGVSFYNLNSLDKICSFSEDTEILMECANAENSNAFFCRETTSAIDEFCYNFYFFDYIACEKYE